MSLLKRIGGNVPTPVEPAASRAPIRPETTGRLPAVGAPSTDETFRELRARVQDRLINELNPQMDLNNPAKVRKQVEEIFNAILDSESIVLSRAERQRLFEALQLISSVWGRSSRCWPMKMSVRLWSTARNRSTSKRRAS